MPIGDLLAQISGDKASGSPAPPARRPDLVTSKRKADEDLHRSASKTPRFTPTPTAKPARPPTNNGILPRPTTSIPARPLSDVHRSSKPVAIAKRPPLPPPSESLKPKGPPKKGSFAEILARGQRAQAVMGQVGKIQHKKVEKGAIKKDAPAPREEVAKKPSAAGAQARRPVSGYSGTAKPALQRNGATEGAAASRNRVGAPIPKHGAAGKKATATAAAAAAEIEKKVKKAAIATTGYTGTARPRPEAPTKKPNAQRGGALLNPVAPRARPSQRSRYEDDYDEELDDFIDYDEEEEDRPPRYDYASDASSDMEAGMDDIDDEERRAEHIARREDLEQERLEKTLKNAKEEKKRRALEALRANRR